MIGIFGDWIFGAPDGSQWHLDLLEGQFRQVARDSAEFNARKREEKYRDEWFGANWANIALENGLTPNRDECLGWKVAPVLAVRFLPQTFRCSRSMSTRALPASFSGNCPKGERYFSAYPGWGGMTARLRGGMRSNLEAYLHFTNVPFWPEGEVSARPLSRRLTGCK